MEKSFYENLLRNNNDHAKAEMKWDERAKQFNLNQQNERNGFAERVTEILNEKSILGGASILDIGGGSGRYAIPFAAYAESITVTDISSNMLELAEKNAENANLNNLQFIKMEWSDADIKAIGWEKKFDLVFASMCPAVRSAKGFKNMLAASKGHCMINQFIVDKDSVTEYLLDVLKIKKGYNPHNDRDSVQAFFNLLWIEGYEPEINYLRTKGKTEMLLEEAVKVYSKKFENELGDKNINMKSLLEPLLTKGRIRTTKEKTAAMITWKV